MGRGVVVQLFGPHARVIEGESSIYYIRKLNISQQT